MNFSNYYFLIHRIINNFKNFQYIKITIMRTTLLINHFINLNFINKSFKVFNKQILRCSHLDNFYKSLKNYSLNQFLN